MSNHDSQRSQLRERELILGVVVGAAELGFEARNQGLERLCVVSVESDGALEGFFCSGAVVRGGGCLSWVCRKRSWSIGGRRSQRNWNWRRIFPNQERDRNQN
ncbi:unnamed protein product [Brassica oleracea]